MIEVESKYILKLFANLSSKQQSKAFKNTLRKASQILVKETRSQLRKGGIKGTTKVHPEWKGISLNKGVQYHIARGKDDESKVNIMGDFRLKFFELGTNVRRYFTKNGREHRTGHIKGINFFNKAKNLKQKEIFTTMNKLLSDNIMKIASK